MVQYFSSLPPLMQCFTWISPEVGGYVRARFFIHRRRRRKKRHDDHEDDVLGGRPCRRHCGSAGRSGTWGNNFQRHWKFSERDLSFEKKERTHYRPLYLPSKLRMRKSLAAFYLPSANYKHYVLHDASEREVSVSQRDPT